MERVATELGIAKGTLYLYFSSKEALFYACVDAGMRQMQSVVLAAADEANELIDRLSRGIRAYLQFFEEHPEHVELLIQERANFKSRSRPTYFEYREQNREKWRPVHEEMIASGRYRTDIPVERIMDAIGNLLYGTMFTNHFVGRAVSLNEQYQSLLEILMRGLLSEEERAVQSKCRSDASGDSQPGSHAPQRRGIDQIARPDALLASCTWPNRSPQFAFCGAIREQVKRSACGLADSRPWFGSFAQRSKSARQT